MIHRIAFSAALLAFALTPGVAAAQTSSPLGLDSAWSCSAGNPVANAADKSEGTGSMLFRASGYSLCTSPKMACGDFSLTSNEVLIDVKLPANLPNPWWVGDVSLYVEVPSASLYNSWVGMAFLTGLPTQQWVTLSIPATPAMMTALRSGCGDAKLKFALNTSAPGVRVDNIRFAGQVPDVDLPPVEMVLTIDDDANDGQFDPSLAILPSGWSTRGERDDVLYVGSYSSEQWGGGNGYTTGAFRFRLSHSIPPGASVLEARLSLYGWGDWEWDNTLDALRVAVELSDDAGVITGFEDEPFSPGGRPTLAQTVRWPASGGLVWQYGAWNQSVDLSGLLQELVDTMGGLEAGSHVQFFVYGDTPNVNSEVIVEDSSNAAGNAPQLTVVFD